MRSLKPRFNVMLVGTKSIGKSTFINTLVGSEIAVNTEDLNTYKIDINCEGVDKTIVMSESPGFDEIDNTSKLTSLLNYIKQQFDMYLQEETKISRDISYEDTRIHCILYFLKPVTKGLKPYDIEILQQLTKYTNVVLVIGKSDAFSPDELNECKYNVKMQVSKLSIPLFNFQMYEKHVHSNNENIIDSMPFAIIASVSKTRQYKNKIINIEDRGVCDYLIVKEVLFGHYVDFFIDYTSCVLYERYRTEMLKELLEYKLST